MGWSFGEVITDIATGAGVLGLLFKSMNQNPAGVAAAGGAAKKGLTEALERFMPRDDGKSKADNIIVGEIYHFLSKEEQKRFDAIMGTMDRNEKRFFSALLALWAHKYQRETKVSSKGSDGKEEHTTGRSPLSEDNPAVVFVKDITSSSDLTPEQTIELLHTRGLIEDTAKDRLVKEWKEYQKKTGLTPDAIAEKILNSLPHEREVMKVGPLGYLFAKVMGSGVDVELYGAQAVKNGIRALRDRRK